MHWSDWILVLGHSIAIVTSSCEHSKYLFTHYVRSQDSLTSFAHSRLDNNNYLALYFLKGVTHLFIHSEFFTFWNSRLILKMMLNCKTHASTEKYKCQYNTQVHKLGILHKYFFVLDNTSDYCIFINKLTHDLHSHIKRIVIKFIYASISKL